MIVHVDLDAFFASVEELDHPHLVGRPVAVGGRPPQGIVTTANYEARRYGIHSAMPVFMAKALCPSLILLPVRMARYKEKSREVFSILATASPLMEQVSIDEAYLDFSHVEHPRERALTLKAEVKEKTGLTLSVGLAPNKFLAKLASDWEKPNGFTEIHEEEAMDLLGPLPVGRIHGVGPRGVEKLARLGIHTVENLWALSEKDLRRIFGKWGGELYWRARGIDHRRVEPERERKSLGVERTFRPTEDEDLLREHLRDHCRELAEDLSRLHLQASCITVKTKDADFSIHTRSKTLPHPIASEEEIFALAEVLFEERPSRRLRLIGVTASHLEERGTEQLSFLPEGRSPF